MPLSFITVIKRSGPDLNGNVYSKEALKRIVECGAEMPFIPGTVGYDRNIDPFGVPIDQIKFRTVDLIYEDKLGGRVRAHVELIDPDPELERFILAGIKARSIIFRPAIVGRVDKDKNVEVHRLLSVDLIQYGDGEELWLDLKKKSEPKSNDSTTE